MVRHGQSEANLTKTIQGTLDSPLTPLGKRQASILKELLPRFDQVYLSPLKRAMETGMIATGIVEEEAVVDDRLSEIHFGDLQGQLYSDFPASREIVRAHIEFKQDALMGKYNAELVSDFLGRTHRVFEDIVKDIKESDLQSVAIFSHGGVLRSIQQHYLNMGSEKWQNCEYGILEMEHDKWFLQRFTLPDL